MNKQLDRRLMRSTSLLLLFIAAAATGLQPPAAFSATVALPDQADRVVAIRNLTVKDGVASGELSNRSSRGAVREVQLLIRYTWLWNDERHPGQDEVGMAVYYTVEGEIPQGGSRPFTYRPSPPLPVRSDGHFEVAVSVAGFTEIIPQK